MKEVDNALDNTLFVLCSYLRNSLGVEIDELEEAEIKLILEECRDQLEPLMRERWEDEDIMINEDRDN